MCQDEEEAFTVMGCRTNTQIKKVCSFTISGQQVTLVQTPSLNTPAWVKTKERLLTNTRWRNCKCVFIYVKAVKSTTDDEESIKTLTEEFGLDRVHCVTCYNALRKQNVFTPQTDQLHEGNVFQLRFGTNAPFKAKVREAIVVLEKLKTCADVSATPLPNEGVSAVDAKSKEKPETLYLRGSQVDPAKLEALIATVDVLEDVEPKNVSKQPIKVENLTQEDWDLFIKALKEGSARSNHVRVNVVGNHGVGKTTLVNRLLGKKVKCPDPKAVPTENLNIYRYTARCEERNDKLHWQTGDQGPFLNDLNIQRMAYAMIETEVYAKYESNKWLDTILYGSDEFFEDETPRLKIPPQSGSSILKGKEEYLKQVLFAKQDIEKNHCERIYFSYWDFAGQATYYATHQLFMSPSAVYLILFDLSKNLNEKVTDNIEFRAGMLKSCTVAEALKFWVHSIQAYTKDDSGGYAPFIIVGTHKAGLSDIKIEEKFTDVRALLKTNAECIAIDNTLDQAKDECLIKLKDTIVDNGLGVFDERVSTQWINLEHDMQKNSECMNGYIKFEKLQELDKNMDVPMCDTVRLEMFLTHQHYRGHLLFYQHSELRSLVITNPMLLVNFLNCLLRRKESEKKQQYLGWNENGILNYKFIIDSANEMGIEENACTAFLKILVNLNVIHPLSSSDTNESLDTFFLPCLLPDKPHTEKDNDDCTRSSLFQIRFDRDSIHQTTYHQIICALLKNLALVEEEDNKLIHNLHACFDVKDDIFVWLVMFWKNSKINFVVKNFNKDNMMNQYVEEVLEKLEEAIEDVLCANHHENVSYSFHVECPKHQENFLKLEHLKERGKALCPVSEGRHTVDIEDVHDVSKTCEDKSVESELLDKPTDKMLARLAWKLQRKETPNALTVRLKLPCAYIRSDIVSRDYRDPGSELFQVLYEWRNHRETNRTCHNLLKLFTKRNDYDMAFLKTAMYSPPTTGFKPESIPEHAAVHNRDISIFSRNIGNGYTFVLLECGIAWYRIQQVRRDHKDDTREMICQLLCEWRKDNPEHSTTNKLLEAAWLYDVPLDGTISELQRINP